MEHILSYHDLWELIERTPKLDLMTNDYKKKNKKCITSPYICFGRSNSSHIHGLSTATNVWTKFIIYIKPPTNFELYCYEIY